MASQTARVPTGNGSRYLQQLCKHWGHKLDVRLDGDTGVVCFPEAVATMAAGPEALAVTVEADDEATLERMKGVVAGHLDRFAFREAPLRFEWSES